MALPNERILGFPVLAQDPQNLNPCFLAIGDNEKRKRFWDELSQSKQLASILAPSACISPHTEIGRNVFIGNFVHIGPEAIIGENTIINTGAIIEHEVRIGDHSHIGPRAVISGRSTIGSLTFVGVGATIKDSIRIGSNIVIGAGAVVVSDLSEPGIYAGCPAKLLRSEPVCYISPSFETRT